MISFELILYTRSGCCLCEGLEEKLKSIPLKELHSGIQFSIKDIDKGTVNEIERTNYSMKVPVLVLKLNSQSPLIELPRVSPRLKKEALLEWLQKMIRERINEDRKI